MRILAVNGSPRGQSGNTERILQPFLEGAREAGAETEVVYLKDKKINHCSGCFTCWTKTPGVCIHRDDMPGLLEKIRQSDVIVFATPLYVYTVSGLMKDFMDRFIPLVQPAILKRGERYSHPSRYGRERPMRAVLISNCGFPGRYNFAGLVETFRLFAAGPNLELAATILCPSGEILRVTELQDSFKWYLDASRSAGREFAGHGRISPETRELLDRDIVDPEQYIRSANAHLESVAAGAGPAVNASGQPGEETISPALPPPPTGTRLPETFREAITGQAASFNPEAAGDLRADIQFSAVGKEPGDYVLRIADGRCTAHEGKSTAPALTVQTPSEVWLQIARGELSGQAAFLQGLYRTEGDLGLLLRMKEIFSPTGEIKR